MTETKHTPTPWEKYEDIWSKKTNKQIEKEIISMRKYMQRYTQAYAWHGSGITPPNNLADGDKITCLRMILNERKGDA